MKRKVVVGAAVVINVLFLVGGSVLAASEISFETKLLVALSATAVKVALCAIGFLIFKFRPKRREIAT